MTDSDAAPSLAACRREIERLHDYFVACYTGAQTDPAPLEQALGAEFSLVTPAGTALPREDVLAMVAEKCNSYEPGSVEIEIRDVRRCHASASHAVARYEEHQRTPTETTARLSTVVFEPEPAAPGNLSWVTVHETWLDGP